MNNSQLPFLVGGILILATMVFGILLSRKGKPYGKVKLIIHLFLFAWFSVGFGFILYGLITMNSTKVIWIPVGLMGLAILVQLVIGVLMMTFRKVGKALPMIHLISAILLVLSDIFGFIIAGLRS